MAGMSPRWNARCPAAARWSAGPPRQLELRLAHRTQLGAVAKGLLEVVSDDLRVLGDPAARGVLIHVARVLVKLRADPLRGRPVGGLLDQDVTEAKALATPRRWSGLDQLLAHQGLDVAGNERARNLGQELNHRIDGELLADDGGAGYHGPHARPEAIEARRQQRRDRRGDRELGLVASPSASMATSCSMKSGFPSAISRTRALVASARLERGCRSASRSLGPEGARAGASSRSAIRRAPARSLLEELRTGDANNEDWCVRTRSARYSTRSRKVCSAQCTSSKKTTSGRSRARTSKRLRVAQKISSRSPAVRRRRSPPEARRQAAAPRVHWEELSSRAGGRELVDYFAQRPERDALAVRARSGRQGQWPVRRQTKRAPARVSTFRSRPSRGS